MGEFFKCYNLPMSQTIKNIVLVVVILILIIFIFMSLNKENTIDKPIKIIAYGDSLTEGFGLSKEYSYPSILEKSLVEKGYKNIKVLNYGISGDTTENALNRIQPVLDEKPDIVILTIGANDMLRRQDLGQMKDNIRKIMSKLKENNTEVILSYMKAPFITGKYGKEFEGVYFVLQSEFKSHHINSFMDGVWGESEYLLLDQLHPNKEGYEIIVKENVLPVLLDVLDEKF